MRLLGQALGREQRAEEFIAFYQQSLAKVTQTLAKAGTVKQPKIFIDMLAGLQDCCGSPGTGNCLLYTSDAADE